MTDPIRDLLISLSSHMAYMQGQLEARGRLGETEDYYWYRESVLLRQKVMDALADEPAAGEPPMTDLTPNDLSHLSDEEFNALCPQGEHAPGPEPLSPAARAVWEAAMNTPDHMPYEYDIAAALCAAADQVVPGEFRRKSMPENVWLERCTIRRQFNAIATELKNQ